MDYKAFIKKINNMSFNNIILLYGEEEYLINYLKQQVIDNMLKEKDFDLIKLKDCKNADNILDSLQSFPLIDNSKIISVRDSKMFEAGKTSNDFEMLLDKLGSIPNDVYVVFEETKIDKRSKLYKLIKKKGEIVECDIQKDDELAKWIMKIFKKNKKKISYNTSKKFVQYSDKKMNSILTETDKMISYLGKDTVLDDSDLEKLVTKNINNTIFQLIDSVLEKDKARAYNLLNQMIYLREAEQKILYLITINFINMYKVKTIYQKTKNINIACKESDVRFVWLAKKLLKTARNIRIEELKKIINECVKTDKRIKKGIMPPRLSLEYLIGKIV